MITILSPDRYDAYRSFDGNEHTWEYSYQGRTVMKASFVIEESIVSTKIEHYISDDRVERFSCSFDKDQTLVPGIKRAVRRASDGTVVGFYAYDDLEYGTINMNIHIQIHGLLIDFYDSLGEDKKLIARCCMYDDRGTAVLQTTRDRANWFSITFQKDLDAVSLLLVLLYPIVGFI